MGWRGVVWWVEFFTGMLCSPKSFFNPTWSLWLNKALYRVTPAWQAFWNIASRLSRTLEAVGVHLSDPDCFFPSSVMSCSSILAKVLMVRPAPSSKGWLVRLMQHTITLPLAPGQLMLLASTTLLLRPSNDSYEAWLCDVRRQESAASFRKGMVVFLIACKQLAISLPNR